MKMLYEAPVVEILTLVGDVITASDGTVTFDGVGNTYSADNEVTWP